MSEPKPLARREVLQTAAALGIGGAALMLAQEAHGAQPDRPLVHFGPQSGLVTRKPKELRYEEIPGLLTKAQVTPHYRAHYTGALNRFNTLEENLEKLYRGKEPLAGDAYVFMQKDKLNRMNSVLLHELYFDNLIDKPPQPNKNIRDALAARFGTFERWQEDFKACCMAANGWGILARDIVNGRLYNVSRPARDRRHLARPAAHSLRRVRARLLRRLPESQAGLREPLRAIPGVGRNQPPLAVAESIAP